MTSYTKSVFLGELRSSSVSVYNNRLLGSYPRSSDSSEVHSVGVMPRSVCAPRQRGCDPFTTSLSAGCYASIVRERY